MAWIMCGKDRASTALGAATCPKPPSCTVPGSSAKEGHRAKLVGIVLRKIRGLSSEPLVSDEYGEATRNVRTAPQHPLRGGPKPVFSDSKPPSPTFTLGEGRALRWFRERCSPQGRRATHSSASRIAPRTAHGPEPQRCPFQKNQNHCRVAMQELENRGPRFLTGLPAPSSHEPAFQCVVASQMRPTLRFGPATYSRQVAAPSKSARFSRLASPRGPHA